MKLVNTKSSKKKHESEKSVKSEKMIFQNLKKLKNNVFFDI
jgi:hypothetical protein